MTEQAKAQAPAPGGHLFKTEAEVWDEAGRILGTADRESWDERIDDLGEATMTEINKVMDDFKLRAEVPANEALRLAWLLIHRSVLYVWAPGGREDDLTTMHKTATLTAVMELSRLLGRG